MRFRPSNRETGHARSRQHDLLVRNAEPCRGELKAGMHAGFGIVKPPGGQRID